MFPIRAGPEFFYWYLYDQNFSMTHDTTYIDICVYVLKMNMFVRKLTQCLFEK